MRCFKSCCGFIRFDLPEGTGFCSGCPRHQFANTGYEPVSTLRKRLDILSTTCGIAKDFAESRNILRKSGLLDYGVGPEPLHEDTLFERVSAVFYKSKKRVEGFGRQRYRLT